MANDVASNIVHAKKYFAKIILVGDSSAGKTSLLQSLRGDIFVPNNLPTTGIEIKLFRTRHPSIAGDIRYNVWDLGGETAFHAAHQLLATDHALYLLVWSAQTKWDEDGGRLRYWLDAIRSSAPHSPIIVVVSFMDQRRTQPAVEELLPTQRLKEMYGQIIDFIHVSNQDRSGISELIEVITSASINYDILVQAGEEYWTEAINSILQASFRRRYIVYFDEISDYLSYLQIPHETLSQLLLKLHQIGTVFWVAGNSSSPIVIYPEAVFQAIAQVLADAGQHIRENFGTLSGDYRKKLWEYMPDLVQDRVLLLMQELQLCYRRGEITDSQYIVLQHIPSDPPIFYESHWMVAKNTPGTLEVARQLEFEAMIPAGVPERFLASASKLAEVIAWKYGALLTSKTTHTGIGLLTVPYEVGRRPRSILLRVRGQQPTGFFDQLIQMLVDSVPNYPNCEIFVPCPCPGESGNGCSDSFSLASLSRRNLNEYVECENQSSVRVEHLIKGFPLPNPETNIVAVAFTPKDISYEHVERIVEIAARTAATAPDGPKVFIIDLIERTNWPEHWKYKFMGDQTTDPAILVRKIVRWAIPKGLNPENSEFSILGDFLRTLSSELGASEKHEIESLTEHYSL